MLSIKQVTFVPSWNLEASVMSSGLCLSPRCQDLVILHLLGGFCVAFCWFVRGGEAGLCRMGKRKTRSPSFFILKKTLFRKESVSCSVMSNSVTPWPVAYQASLSMGFSRQERWSGLPFPSPQVYLSHALKIG